MRTGENNEKVALMATKNVMLLAEKLYNAQQGIQSPPMDKQYLTRGKQRENPDRFLTVCRGLLIRFQN